MLTFKSNDKIQIWKTILTFWRVKWRFLHLLYIVQSEMRSLVSLSDCSLYSMFCSRIIWISRFGCSLNWLVLMWFLTNSHILYFISLCHIMYLIFRIRMSIWLFDISNILTISWTRGTHSMVLRKYLIPLTWRNFFNWF